MISQRLERDLRKEREMNQSRRAAGAGTAIALTKAIPIEFDADAAGRYLQTAGGALPGLVLKV
ncbi:hypothetical protein A5765_01195 [Mycolicibacterium celeriflavum]|uniref:hypothetical protein n=1 Tax=Mycolicibacterium celeriflavum TaxID=1249101 RepID=UPI0008011F2D|nr:hypothetical protein [Mycolicibacterium celeriflavum]OBG23373.1 hypothetical protein A5765_01195 [Mycolicibacterium celeriflavum]